MNDRLRAVADVPLADTLLHVRRSSGGVTADDVAGALGIHRNAARGRLERLAEAGLLEVTHERRSGRRGPGAGRPAKVYRVAPESEALELPARRLPRLVARLLDEVPRRGRAAALRRAGADFGRDLAETAGLDARADPAEGVEQACAALRSLGFQASTVRVADGVAEISTPTCPLRPLVVERPEAAEIDHGMWAGLVERAVSGVRAEDVVCETHSCLEGHESCGVTVRFAARGGRAAPGTEQP